MSLTTQVSTKERDRLQSPAVLKTATAISVILFLFVMWGGALSEAVSGPVISDLWGLTSLGNQPSGTSLLRHRSRSPPSQPARGRHHAGRTAHVRVAPHAAGGQWWNYI